MATKEYVSLSKLSIFLDNLKSLFATKTEVDGKANTTHNHAASSITSGTLSSNRLPVVPITKGGTGAITATDALVNLGVTATATELNYVDGVTSSIQTQLNGKAETAHGHNEATASTAGFMSSSDKTQLDYGGVSIVTTSGTGSVYTATVDGITALTAGIKITIIPHTVSTTTTPKLNLNSLGEKYIRMPITYNTSATSVGAIASWLAKNKPVTLEYDGTYWKTISIPRPSAQYLYGVVPVSNGGTGISEVSENAFLVGAKDGSESILVEKTSSEVLQLLGIVDYVTETGTSTTDVGSDFGNTTITWTYQKFKSGQVNLYGVANGTISTTGIMSLPFSLLSTNVFFMGTGSNACVFTFTGLNASRLAFEMTNAIGQEVTENACFYVHGTLS